MARTWDKVSRAGLDAAATATSVGFSAAKYGTQLGFSIPRGIISTAAGLTGSAIDKVLFNGSLNAGAQLSSAVSSAFSFAEGLALLPILIGESVTSTSLIAAHSSVNVLSAIFPGSDEASFSLASFVTLVKREWDVEDGLGERPGENYGVGEVATALVAWSALQAVTAEWAEQRWFKSLKEIEIFEEPQPDPSSSLSPRSPSTPGSAQYSRERRESRIHVNSNSVLPGNSGQIITADIGEASECETGPIPGSFEPLGAATSGGPVAAPFEPVQTQTGVHFDGLPSTSGTDFTNPFSPSSHSSKPIRVDIPATSPRAGPKRMTNAELKSTLRRLSKLVLAGYGGSALLFFGVSPTPPTSGPSIQTQGDSKSPMAAVYATSGQKRAEEASLATALAESEAEARAEGPAPPSASPGYSWWNVLMGRHDHDIIRAYADAPLADAQKEIRATQAQDAQAKRRDRTTSVIAGQEHLMPRFWVLKDHGRKQVVLVIRGTMSLNELAVDLTCDPEDFEPARSSSDLNHRAGSHSTGSTARPRAQETSSVPNISEEDEDLEDMPGFLPSPTRIRAPAPPTRTHSASIPHQPFPSASSSASAAPHPPKPLRSATFPAAHTDPSQRNIYKVHGGMLRMSRAMGRADRPLHVAVKDALRRNKGYDLVLCGHSLGAGVAALLGLSWADPRTCLTVKSSGLPSGRSVSVYCIAPPCVADLALTKLASKMITSFVYSHDIVSRLSLGSIRDIRNAAMWLCNAQAAHKRAKSEAKSRPGPSAPQGNGEDTPGTPPPLARKGEGYTSLTKRALKYRAGLGKEDDPVWFLSMRKTLEANMQNQDLYPPGRTWWAMHNSELHPNHRSSPAGEGGVKDKLRLFEVLEPEKVFGQIVFARDMLSSHLPHQYDRALHELL